MSTCSPPPLMFGSSLMTAARHCICQPESISVSPSLNEPFIWGGKKRGRGNKWQTYYRSQYKYMPHFQRSCLRVNQNQPLRKEGKLTLQTPELTPCINWQTQPWSKSAAQTKGGQSPATPCRRVQRFWAWQHNENPTPKWCKCSYCYQVKKSCFSRAAPTSAVFMAYIGWHSTQIRKVCQVLHSIILKGLSRVGGVYRARVTDTSL